MLLHAHSKLNLLTRIRLYMSCVMLKGAISFRHTHVPKSARKDTNRIACIKFKAEGLQMWPKRQSWHRLKNCYDFTDVIDSVHVSLARARKEKCHCQIRGHQKIEDACTGDMEDIRQRY